MNEIKLAEQAIKMAKVELKEWSKFLALAMARLIKLKQLNARQKQNKTISSRNRKRVA